MNKRNKHENESCSIDGCHKAMMYIHLVFMVIVVVMLFVINSNIIDMSAQPTIDTIKAAAPTKAAPAAQPAEKKIDTKALIDSDDHIKGNKDAKVTIIEFSDFECPFCARFYNDAYKQIVTKYIDTGKVNLVYKDFPLSFHKQAQKAAEAAECAGEQGKYYEMHNMLFDKGVAGGVASFKQYAADLSLDTTKFNTCLDSGAMAEEIKKDMVQGQAAGIRGTPGFIINGELISGAQPFSVFEAAIEKALGN